MLSLSKGFRSSYNISRNLRVNSLSRTFAQPFASKFAKYDYEDALNFKFLLTEEEKMV